MPTLVSAIARTRRAALPRALVAVGMLAAVIWMVDAPRLADRLVETRPAPVIAAILLVQLQVVLSAERWRLTAGQLGQGLARPRAIAEYYGASLLNQLLPGGVSGDVIRAWRNRADRPADTAERHAPAQAIMIERLAGQIALIGTAVTGWLLWPWLGHGPIPGAAPMLVTMLILVGGLAVGGWALARFAPSGLARFVDGLGRGMRRSWLRRDGLVRQLGLSLAVVASYLGAFALASAAVGATLSFAATLALIPLVLLTMLLPVSVAGWGVREAAAAALWPLAGASAADGVAASVVYGLVCLLGVAPGAILLVRRRADIGHGARRRA